MNPRYFVISCTIVSLMSCQNKGANQNDCKYGTPKAIFSSEQPSVQDHTFTALGNEGTEKVTFQDGLGLTLLQSGCNHIRQEFQFTINGNFEEQPSGFWIEKTMELLKRLSSMGLDYQVFGAWAEAIDSKKSDIKLTESTNLGAGFFVKIDRILNTQNATLVVILSDEP